MHYFLKVALLTFVLTPLLPLQPVYSQNSSINSIKDRLEEGLNKKNENIFKDLFTLNNANILESKYNYFLSSFPNASWDIRYKKEDQKKILIINITAERDFNQQEFVLNAQQKLVIETNGEVITNHEILSEYSILKSSDSNIDVIMNIPDSVLTGSRYDVDIIIDKPLGDSIIAGGLIDLKTEEIYGKGVDLPYIDIAPIGSGGLFKNVQAPMQPGIQNWAALIAHPDGIISITKSVNVKNNL